MALVMWLLGVFTTAVVAVLFGQLLARGQEEPPSASVWDIPRTAATYTSIVGMLAGFSVVVMMFFANLTVARSSPEYESVIGMLLIAFLLFISAAMQFGTTPNQAENEDSDFLLVQRSSYLMANACYFCGIACSWLALKLFLDAIQLPYLSSVFTWILLFAVFTGSVRMAQFLARMSSLSRSACLISPILGFGLAALFRFVVVPNAPGFSPPANEPFLLSVCLFGIGCLSFLWQSFTVTGDVASRPGAFLIRYAERLQLGYLQSVFTVVALTWLAVS